MRLPGTESRVNAMGGAQLWPSGPLCARAAYDGHSIIKLGCIRVSPGARFPHHDHSAPRRGYLVARWATVLPNTSLTRDCVPGKHIQALCALELPSLLQSQRCVHAIGLRPGQTHIGALRHGATQPAPKPMMCRHNRTPSGVTDAAELPWRVAPLCVPMTTNSIHESAIRSTCADMFSILLLAGHRSLPLSF